MSWLTGRYSNNSLIAQCDHYCCRLDSNVGVKKIARAFISVEKFGVKFKEDNVADAFLKAVEKARCLQGFHIKLYHKICDQGWKSTKEKEEFNDQED